ncbi:hypothetical protein ACFQYP_40620 [Nonomuraea antimicrobica]
MDLMAGGDVVGRMRAGDVVDLMAGSDVVGRMRAGDVVEGGGLVQGVEGVVQVLQQPLQVPARAGGRPAECGGCHHAQAAERVVDRPFQQRHARHQHLSLLAHIASSWMETHAEMKNHRLADGISRWHRGSRH